ncbi:starch synthase 3, chloroplastic/amyloplastic-like [Selaginella moellendorffii]|uniref:starch synthase 3, chloroplastic/amyloplastic-like n=1 Tax=Selaginella moellendorffii TaxID=88036 RepID=UPI000D1D0267|nr:starch synthase 3, chloroplastic/amyloplastic-like [Selaginella moellendorffii]|eukprot:XP_024543721.1 starch synthase 3, chloroplastic/amyloplastic-like [Selaginella moellendorffii]
MATAASLVAASAAAWKVSSAGGLGSSNERFLIWCRRERRSSRRNFKTIVCAGERQKGFQQKLKEKKTSKPDDVSEATSFEVKTAKAGRETSNDEETETAGTEKVVVEPTVAENGEQDQVLEKMRSQSASISAHQEVDYVVAKQRIEEEVERFGSGRLKGKTEAADRQEDDSGGDNSTVKVSEVKDKDDVTEANASDYALKIKEIKKETEKRRRTEEEIAEAESRKRADQEATAARRRELEQILAKQQAEKKKKLEQEAKKREIELALAKERERIAKEAARKREIAKLADASAFTMSKIFYYPQKVEAGAEVEIYFNRSITVLASEDSVQIMGSFNGWRWQPFTLKLEKSELGGDWWACKMDVPKEAYRMDFVFFNGNVYENNDTKDFFVLVDDGMDQREFENFLVLEKRKEAERLAQEQAEKDRAAAEARKLAEQRAAEKADRDEAKRIVAQRRERARMVLQQALPSVPGLWDAEPTSFKAGETVKLFYNRSSRSLARSTEIWIHGGYNNWQDAVSVVEKLVPSSSRSGDWWSVEVSVPKAAFMLNWVFADGPPEKASTYDNNDYQDFHMAVPEPVAEELYWADVEEQVYSEIRKQRQEREEAARKKKLYKAQKKEEMKQKTKQAFLQSQSHVYYTDPMEVNAGEPVSVLYNPQNTVLSGKPEVWLRHSFNRWTHQLSPFPPVRMKEVPSTTHLKATVEVPVDAYIMDCVFSERGDDNGGTYDNRGGFDYHIPVHGGIGKEPPMSIVHISVEMAPIAKVGGLGDVVTSLSRAVQELGHNVEIILPKYDCLKYNHVEELQEKESFGWGGTTIRVWNGKVEGLNVHFIEPQNGFFWAGCIYGRRDDGHRFGFFCNAALEFLLRSGRRPDIIHCHDWSTAPVAWLFQESYKHYALSNARIVFTIHNLEFGIAQVGKAMASSNMATTVSHSYAQEVSGSPAIAPHRGKFHGIRNGIDLDIWDPFDDPYIPVSYTAEQVVEGKRAAKSELQHRLGLQQVDKPLVGIITRLTAQKGIHLIKHAIWRTLERGGQVVLLGSAPDPRVQNDFVNLSHQLKNFHNDMARLCLTYDEPLSHLIYAGADFILVPSIFEPCGLTQLTAMRYGAIPVVRKTGGLNDTVFDADHDKDRAQSQGLEPNGFSFEGTDAAGVDYALNRALSAWYDARDWFHSLCQKVMEQDWSWNRPALDYVELYYLAKK